MEALNAVPDILRHVSNSGAERCLSLEDLDSSFRIDYVEIERGIIQNKVVRYKTYIYSPDGGFSGLDII